MECVADQPTLVSELRHRLDRLGVHIQDADTASHLLDFAQPPATPAGLEGAVSSFGDRLWRDHELAPDEVLLVLQGELGAAAAQPACEDVRVEDDLAGQS